MTVITSLHARSNAIQPTDRWATSLPDHCKSPQSPTAMAAYSEIHGKKRPGKPNRYLRSFVGCGGHRSGAGTVRGSSGDHPPLVELGMSLGELIRSLMLTNSFKPRAAGVPVRSATGLNFTACIAGMPTVRTAVPMRGTRTQATAGLL